MAGGGEGPVDLRLRPPLGPFSLSPGRGGRGACGSETAPPSRPLLALPRSPTGSTLSHCAGCG